MALTVFSAIVDWVLFPKLSLQAKRLFFLILCYQTSSAPLQLLHSSLLSHFISVRCSQRGNRLASDDLTQGSTRSGRLLASPLYRWGLIERRLSVQIILLWVIVQVPSFINKRQMRNDFCFEMGKQWIGRENCQFLSELPYAGGNETRGLEERNDVLMCATEWDFCARARPPLFPPNHLRPPVQETEDHGIIFLRCIVWITLPFAILLGLPTLQVRM